MNLQKVKKALSECHVEAGPVLDLFKDVNCNYLIDRIIEELRVMKGRYLVKLSESTDESAKKVIQLTAMFRVKLIEEQNGTVQDGQKK